VADNLGVGLWTRVKLRLSRRSCVNPFQRQRTLDDFREKESSGDGV